MVVARRPRMSDVLISHELVQDLLIIGALVQIAINAYLLYRWAKRIVHLEAGITMLMRDAANRLGAQERKGRARRSLSDLMGLDGLLPDRREETKH